MYKLYFQDLLEHFVKDFHISEIDFCNLEVVIGAYKKEVITKADADKSLEILMYDLYQFDFISMSDYININLYNDMVLGIYEDKRLCRYEIALLDYDIVIFIEWDIE